MPSRYTSNQKKKNPFIMWVLILLSIVVVAAAATWFYIQSKDNPANIDDAAKNEVQNSQSPVEEQPKEDEAVEEKTQEPEETEAPEQAEPKEKETQEEPSSGSDPKEQKTAEDAAVYSDTIELPKEPTVIKGILLANKQHPLPETYAPGEGKEARAAFEEMRKQALQEGIDLVAFSTYRDFARQKELYSGYVAKDGQKAADRYSARPGYSEHQTGLAFDIGEAGQEQHWASASFGSTKGGKWLAENAHNYGFILRYPEGSESITGYMHESWHFRYIGEKAATEIHEKGITLEQYLGV